MDKKLKEIFTDPVKSSAAFTGAHNVFKEAKKRNLKVSFNRVTKFMRGQESHTRHFPARKKFRRRITYATAIDSDWQADLADMQKLKTKNKGNSYLVTIVDVLSKYCWAVPIKKKKPEYVAAAFAKVLEESGRCPARLYTDRGLEFRGRPFQDFLKEHQIQHLTTKNDTVKAALAERLNRTVKGRLWKYFTHNDTKKYLDVLPSIMHGINHSYQRSIKMKPADVNKENEDKVYNTLYGKKMGIPVFKLDIGDLVRIPEKKETFHKGYEPGFSKEIFVVERRILGNPSMYKVRSADGVGRLRSYYESELIKVTIGRISDALARAPPPDRVLRSWK